MTDDLAPAGLNGAVKRPSLESVCEASFLLDQDLSVDSHQRHQRCLSSGDEHLLIESQQHEQTAHPLRFVFVPDCCFSTQLVLTQQGIMRVPLAMERKFSAGHLLNGGRYRVVRELNQGATAVVYVAQDTSTGGYVALKVRDRAWRGLHASKAANCHKQHTSAAHRCNIDQQHIIVMSHCGIQLH